MNHLQQGHGCGVCASERHREVSGRKSLEFEHVRDKINATGDTLLSTSYVGSKAKLDIQCVGCGEVFQMRWSNIQQGQGCPSCARTGFDPPKPAYLYYVKIFHRTRELWKIGITNRTVKERFSREPTEYVILQETYYENGRDAYAEEQRILKLYKEFRYKGDNLLVSGNTECFTENVFGL